MNGIEVAVAIAIALILLWLATFLYKRLFKWRIRRWWYRNVYLHTPHWKAKRKEALIHFRYSCAHCGATSRLDCHHKAYYRNGHSVLWHETMDDLEILCRQCHNKEHRR